MQLHAASCRQIEMTWQCDHNYERTVRDSDMNPRFCSTGWRQETTQLPSQLRVVDTARNLGVVVSCQCLHMLQQSVVAAAISCGNCAHSRDAWRAKPLKHWRMRSRLDYCNVLYCSRLQSVQNAAACLVTGLGRREHITPALRQLHWFDSVLFSSWRRRSTARL